MALELRSGAARPSAGLDLDAAVLLAGRWPTVAKLINATRKCCNYKVFFNEGVGSRA